MLGKDLIKYCSVSPHAHKPPFGVTFPRSHPMHASKASLNPRHSRGAAMARRRRLQCSVYISHVQLKEIVLVGTVLSMPMRKTIQKLTIQLPRVALQSLTLHKGLARVGAPPFQLPPVGSPDHQYIVYIYIYTH